MRSGRVVHTVSGSSRLRLTRLLILKVSGPLCGVLLFNRQLDVDDVCGNWFEPMLNNACVLRETFQTFWARIVIASHSERICVTNNYSQTPEQNMICDKSD